MILAGLILLCIWLLWPLAIVPAALWAWVLWFFRDPERSCEGDQRDLVAVADGRVTDVTHLGPECVLGCDAVQVGVFMSIFDVHVNRSPASGTIVDIGHRPGSLLDVRRPEAWGANEAATITMEIDLGAGPRRIVFRQIAGLVARRIITDVQPGQEVQRGQRIGMIRFGSRGELIVPGDMVEQVRVAVGEKVKAGRTVLLRLSAKPGEADE